MLVLMDMKALWKKSSHEAAELAMDITQYMYVHILYIYIL